ncbi:hypothetical protein GFL93_14455 [Rhizobium leguminosarum bv. viciae]|uniref:Uncharacterized protein n=1 Tax=Rhizobium leguminosarum bv. viciae TaxID=387 RepID=A0A8G2J3U0_RHILV|nr:hypothetical protein [Rhizobium leguminosarum bv. viciae]TBF82937.1 hypothetical protein ELG86_12745 [Rhizobium leguminosarum]NKK18824.1 hypothetical protein [Rhizobium leguminosarum bv. viciae]TBF99355.1 hypothetical protein ELG85_11770 [Rhizobium leguminosarum]TBG68540.1 hypothetical protein ELG74_12090 [Rhizobium leguminosarum]
MYRSGFKDRSSQRILSHAPCPISAAYQPAADARDKPEHDDRGVGRLVSSLSRLRPVAMPRRRRVPPY